MKTFPGIWLITGLMSLPVTTSIAAETQRQACLVIAHRGASAYIPEHTLAAYRLAILLGADFIEPDLVMTRDGHFISRHENRLAKTTNISDIPALANRRAKRTTADEVISDWFSEDFSLAELKQLRARERVPAIRPANSALNDLFPVVSLQEIIDLVKQMESIVGRTIGLYPELKTPETFRQRGLDPERRLVEVLHDNGYQSRDAAIFIQSFDSLSLQRLKKLTPIRLTYLISKDADNPEQAMAPASPAALREIAAFADGIGVEKYSQLIPRDEAGQLFADRSTDLVERARAMGLFVHAWTFRAENEYLPTNLRRPGPATARGDSLAEHLIFAASGVDGLFTDNPDIGRVACDEIAAAEKP